VELIYRFQRTDKMSSVSFSSINGGVLNTFSDNFVIPGFRTTVTIAGESRNTKRYRTVFDLTFLKHLFSVASRYPCVISLPRLRKDGGIQCVVRDLYIL
jgi:hypothetical protein